MFRRCFVCVSNALAGQPDVHARDRLGKEIAARRVVDIAAIEDLEAAPAGHRLEAEAQLPHEAVLDRRRV